MTLKEAYEQWGKLKERQTLYIKTRNAFMQVWKKLDFSIPCKEVTLAVLREALEKRGPVYAEDKARAASVMVHVLTFAHQEQPQECPMPRFDYGALLKDAETERKVLKIERKLPENVQKLPKVEQKLPDMEQRKQTRVTPKKPYQGERDTLGRSKNRAKRKVAQIDPSTLEVVKVWDSMGAAEKELGIRNVTRAIDKKRIAGGFYWCDEKDAATFEPRESMRGRKSGTAGKPAGTATEPLPTEQKASKDDEDVANAPEAEDIANAVERGIEDFIGGFGHGAVQPGKTAVAPTLSEFTDKELIDEVQRRGWKGDVTLKVDNVEVKITL
jgi:hypothetical protein